MENNCSSITFLLVKPDGLKNEKLNHEIIDTVFEYNLNIIDTYFLTITDDIINGLWPSYNVCYLTRCFLSEYLLGEVCKVIILSGKDATKKVNNIKSKIRNTYQLGLFSNCVHTPSNDIESYYDLCLLSQSTIENGEKPKVLLKGLWGKFDDLGETEIRKITRNVWELIEVYGWHEVFKAKVYNDAMFYYGDKDAYIRLYADKNTFDYFVSAIYELFCDISPEESVITILELHCHGEIALCDKDKFETVKMAKKLKNLGFKVELVLLSPAPNGFFL